MRYDFKKRNLIAHISICDSLFKRQKSLFCKIVRNGLFTTVWSKKKKSPGKGENVPSLMTPKAGRHPKKVMLWRDWNGTV